MILLHSTKIATVALVLTLSACASPPEKINNVCAVFDQKDGWISNWQSSAKRAERRHGVPVPILMATLRKESGFKARARPPRRYYLGFIPGPRASSAYGYSQALDGTWSEYVAATRNFGARRSDFADAIDFVGWYHARSARTLGIAPDDAYNLYLAYYSGHAGYRRGDWRSNAGLQNYARQTAEMADRYAAQLAQCG